MAYGTRNSINEQQHESANKQAATAQFVDKRASAATQLKQQTLMAGSPTATAQRAAVNVMNASAVQQQKIIQRVAPEEELQMKSIHSTAQLAGIDEEELLQGKFEPVQRAEKPNNTGLPDNLKSGIENLSGMSMDHVKVHYNSDKPAQLQAHAYAQGSEIHVAPGQEKHLPHEAWHVVQQAQGRVKPTVQMKGNVQVNDDVGLEGEADLMGARANNLQSSINEMTGNSSQAKQTTQHIQKETIVQRLEETDDGSVWSTNRIFVTNYFNGKQNNQNLLGSRHNLPELGGVFWQSEGSAKHADGREVTLYKPIIDDYEDDGNSIKVPMDCLTTAEIVSAWIQALGLNKIGEVRIPIAVQPANKNTAIGPGDILFHLHTRNPGDFHAAAVIATDAGDVITMEADLSENKIDAMDPIFDMYAGHAGFRDDQDPKGSKGNERTYVIHIDEGRHDNQTLWVGIQDQIDDNRYTEGGQAAAIYIRDAIQLAIEGAMDDVVNDEVENNEADVAMLAVIEP